MFNPYAIAGVVALFALGVSLLGIGGLAIAALASSGNSSLFRRMWKPKMQLAVGTLACAVTAATALPLAPNYGLLTGWLAGAVAVGLWLRSGPVPYSPGSTRLNQ